MANYTIQLLYPDYLADNHGLDHYTERFSAQSVDEAVAKAYAALPEMHPPSSGKGPDP